MKHKFLLDENILYYALEGVAEDGRPDLTATNLVRLIGQNCHRIVVDRELSGRYVGHLRLKQLRTSLILQPIEFFNEFVLNWAKSSWESADPANPPVIPKAANIPVKDTHIIRLALVSQAMVITCDRALRLAINGYPAFGVRALTPDEAIPFASDS